MKLRTSLSSIASTVALSAVVTLTAATPSATAAPPAGTEAAEPARVSAGASVSTPRAADDPDAGYGRMMLVLDSSGSMADRAAGGQTKIAAAKRALTTVVNRLPDEADVGLRVFGAQVFSRTDPGSCEDSQLVVEPGVDNREDLLAAVESYKPYGETPIPHALREAARDLGNEGPRSILLVSDGESTCEPDPCVVAAELAEQGVNLQIDVVGLSVSAQARRQLECIAERGNGTYYDADSAAEIEGKLAYVAERTLRPFTLTGEPIEGGTEDDPTPVTVGDWIDRLGPEGSPTGSRSFVYERTTSDTTLRASAVSQGERGDDGLRIDIVGPDGSRCDRGNAIRQIDARDVVGVQATAATDSDCGEPGEYVITVSRRLGGDRDIPFTLRVAEEPPVADPGAAAPDAEASAVPPQVEGRPQPAVGGSSFANATEVGPGRWSGTVVPGEALMYKVPLEFGQAARIRVTFPEATPAMREVVGLFPPLSQVTTYNPMQAQLSAPDGAEVSARAGRDETTLLTGTPAISRDLVDFGSVNGVADYSMAGDYYVAVSLMREDYSIEFPFVLDVEVVGEPVDGPTYADEATWTVADGAVYPDGDGEEPSSSEPTPDDGTGAEPQDAGSDSALTSTTTGVLVGLAGLLVLAGALLLWRRRRA